MSDQPKRRASGSPRPNPRRRTGGGARTDARKTSRPKAAAPRARTGARPHAASGRPAAPRDRKPSAAPSVGRRALKTAALLAIAALVALAVTGCAVYSSMSNGLPDPDVRAARGRDQSTVITDRNGKGLARVFADENRQDVALEKMPAYVRQAVIATEDRRFYEHEGVDPLGIARALVVDIVRGEKAQGGSTITQQYVKQAFVTSEKTLKRKIQEAILAQRVERRYSKDEILELYLNTIYFGHGAYGIQAASRAYFDKSVTKLTLPEAALIAGVIKSPGRYSPYLDPEAALGRRNVVLKQMLDQGYIDEAEYQEASSSEIEVAGLKPSSSRAPYFVEWVKQQLVDRYGKQAVYRGGLRVKTTLDYGMQRAAEKSIDDVLNRKGDPSAALVAIRPSTGEVLAMVGGRDFEKQQFNVAVQGRRQPGSAFKPFVLATALADGVNPEKTFPSGARTFDVGDQTWRVTGASGGSGGKMRLRTATEQSVNSVFAQLVLDVGPAEVVRTGERLGLHGGIDPVPAIALGGLSDGVSPLEMARAYATLANGGTRTTPYGIARVNDAGGTRLLTAKTKSASAIDPAVAYLTTDILTGVIERGTGTAAQIGRPAAGKTGTTQQYRDAWFVGYTPDLAVAVWVGYPDEQREMTSVHGRAVTGGSFPAEIWAGFMRAALEDAPAPDFDRPSGLKSVKVCSETGGRATEYCPEPISALVLADHQPDPCEKHETAPETKVPTVVGLTKLQAITRLEKADLVPDVTEKAVAGATPGSVVSQNPAPGTKLKAGSAVKIVVASTGAANAAPVPVIDGPAEADAGKKAAFDGSGSTDDGTIAKYLWEFGDGTTAEGVKATHRWSVPGTYDVTLWVTDNLGAQASITRQVTVR